MRLASTTNATCVPSRMPYLRRRAEGITNWPLLVTVEKPTVSGGVLLITKVLHKLYSKSIYYYHHTSGLEHPRRTPLTAGQITGVPWRVTDNRGAAGTDREGH
jgi:hypothetical protein